MNIRRTAVLLTLAGLLLGAGLAPVQASEGLTIRPAFIEERVFPGQSFTEIVFVTNRSDESQTFYPTVRDIVSMDESGKPKWADRNAEKSGAELSSWVTFSIPQIALAPEQTAEVAVTFSVPVNAPNGGFFGMVGFEKEPPEFRDNESGLGIGFTTGALASLRVGEDAFDDALLRSFRSTDRLSGGADTTFETRIENTGNALIRPTGFIQISNMFGEQVASTSFNETAGAILPGAIRRYETNWVSEGMFFGRYEALLVVGYGDVEKKTFTGTTSFWIIPGRLTLIVGSAVLVLFLLVFGWARMYIRRKLKAAGAPAVAKNGTSSSTIFVAALIAVIVTAVVLIGFAFFFLI